MVFTDENGALVAKRQGETLRIEGWGEDSLRVRSTMYPDFTGNNWALEKKSARPEVVISQREDGPFATITNGRIKATVNFAGVISFYKDDSMILREYFRCYGGTESKESRCLKYINRDYKPHVGGDYKITVKFESNDGEKIFGMGQYQHPYSNLKGCILDLEQRNSQVSIPFEVSSLGYGFLWNNPAVGRATFGMNYTEWVAEASKEMDYWITVSDTPKGLLENYTAVTGRTPQMPEDLMGLWQCKLRYRTQQEVLEVAHKCKNEGIPIDCIVIDFFHWTVQGDWKFDETYWPDPKAMVDELHSMGIKVVVSVWPSVDKRSEHFYEMLEKGLLVKNERGGLQNYDYQGDCTILDATNPQTREYVWNICKKNYYDLGIDMFWLDNSEPDLVKYDFDMLRYYLGPGLEVSNIYPQYYSRLFYENMKKETDKPVVNLLRSAWAGSQKYGNVVWSGDVPSTFESLKDQIAAGLNMGLSGISWWTTDIGGFMTDDVNAPDFKQLLVRWFEFAVFSPVLRMHGDRGPYDIEPLDNRDFGGGYLHTGQPNELWSYGEEVYEILKKQLQLRIELKPYIKSLFEESSENGSPLLRTLFYEFPEDEKCWETFDEYMFGSSYLVAPVTDFNCFERKVYLPEGKWKDIRDEKVYEGGQIITAKAPLESIPVFSKI
ncbi:alpha-D-xyloside xylohydrolase [Butyrivibrio sp. Su6]|uniref:glycoside hydrolase family 31 protein n=1 Tax=Butyrivibrio sp. Su6 TaxID=1520810 RepID=UPI00089EE580|nr:TIM-barrel domain-containing protein [Butyrivibrio sp. Su6]SEF97211.1 alpha-D-xyloside xylohydrolase [Butyrivibrio sp. Su6]